MLVKWSVSEVVVSQEYYVEEGVWAGGARRGWAARGGFGHAAAWDPLSRKVYVHGGLVSESEATQVCTSRHSLQQPC